MRKRSHSRAVQKIVPRGISAGRAKRLVYDGVYRNTRGGLTASDLVENKYGHVVSRKKMAAGKKLQRQNPFKKNPKFMKHKGRIEEIASK